MKAINLKCIFCEQITGTVEIPEEKTVEEMSIIDVRCDAHREEHGDFAEMSRFYIQNINNNDQEAEDFVKEVRTKKEFVASLLESHSEKIEMASFTEFTKLGEEVTEQKEKLKKKTK